MSGKITQGFIIIRDENVISQTSLLALYSNTNRSFYRNEIINEINISEKLGDLRLTILERVNHKFVIILPEIKQEKTIDRHLFRKRKLFQLFSIIVIRVNLKYRIKNSYVYIYISHDKIMLEFSRKRNHQVG